MKSGSPPEPSRRPLVGVGVLGVGAAVMAGLLLRRAFRRSGEPPEQAATRGLAAGATVLALSVALDSGIEHYRGSFKDPVMFVAPLVAVSTLAAGGLSLARPERKAGTARNAIFAAAMATGAIGTAFHLYNVGKREGGFDFPNLFYAAPLGAPAAIGLAGLFGLLGQRFASGKPARILGLDAAPLIAALSAVALLGTASEAGFLHFRGAFQDPVMYAPVTVPPIAAASLLGAAVTPAAAPTARRLLEATAVLGLAGPLFHAYGVHRNMGGWKNWSQMILQGPPIPAPPAFFGIALVGLGMLPQIEQRRG